MGMSAGSEKNSNSTLEFAVYAGGGFIGGFVTVLGGATVLKNIADEIDEIASTYNENDFLNVKANAELLYKRGEAQVKPLSKSNLTGLQTNIQDISKELNHKEASQLLVNTANRIEYAKENFYFKNEGTHKDSINNIINETYTSVGNAQTLVQNDLNMLSQKQLSVGVISMAVMGMVVYSVYSKFKRLYKK